MGIVLFSAAVAWLLFREKLTVLNQVGIGLALVAIAMIAYGWRIRNKEVKSKYTVEQVKEE